MTSIDIYTILSSKPHNPHYIKRYYKFIQSFQYQLKTKGITEQHHICPKSSDLFPEYKSIKINNWNSIHLTKRQHFIAHWLLSKSYGGKQIYAFWGMCNNQSPHDIRKRDYNINSKTYERAKNDFVVRASKDRTDKVSCWDTNGNFFIVSKEDYASDPNLSSNMKGMIYIKNIITKETKSISKIDYMTFFDKDVWVPGACKGIYHTPYGKYTSSKHPDVNASMCKNNDRLISINAINVCKSKIGNCKLNEDMIGKTYKEAGFWYEKFE